MEFKFIKQFFKGFIIALKMGKSKKPSTSGAAAIIAPMKTLDETDTAVLECVLALTEPVTEALTGHFGAHRVAGTDILALSPVSVESPR